MLSYDGSAVRDSANGREPAVLREASVFASKAFPPKRPCIARSGNEPVSACGACNRLRLPVRRKGSCMRNFPDAKKNKAYPAPLGFMMMKKLFPLVLLSGWLSLACTTAVSAGHPDAPGIHAIGNGELCVYGQGSDILQAFGPPYSSPGMFTMRLEGDRRVVSEREPRTAVWRHTISDESGTTVRLTDLVTDEGCAFVRRFRAEAPVRYSVEIRMEERYSPYEKYITVRPEAPQKGHSCDVRIDMAPGIPFYSSYLSPSGYRYRIVTTGSISLTPQPEHPEKMTLNVSPGEGTLYLVAGPTEEALQTNLRKVLSASPDALQKGSVRNWKKYSAQGTKFSAGRLSGADRDEYLQAVDDIAVLIRSQQASCGAVLAGIVYHMGYVRDQYGVSRALLALGHTEEARRILDFYDGGWRENGFIKNAQAIGWPGIFHRHENDETEITGYLLVQAFDYHARTGDDAFIERILPMLEWAADAQRRHIIDGMLPFNGDETYIAGGVVPRKVMYHGSAEATLLFIEGGTRLLDFVRERPLGDAGRIETLGRAVAACREAYRDNFFRDEKLFINNPEREKKVVYPATRPGVCLHPDHFDYFTETYHFKGCLYFCKDCIEKDNSAVEQPSVERFSIPSACLFPLYIHSELFTEDEKRALLEQVVELYRATGKISDRDRILGYDYGMFLYALAEQEHELSGEVYRKMMDLRDSAGAWVEYYVDGHPSGCGGRPGESGIDIEAAIRYAER